MRYGRTTALDRGPGRAAVNRAGDHAVIACEENCVRSGVFDIPKPLTAALWLDYLPGCAAVDRAHDVPGFTYGNTVKAIDEAGVVCPSVWRSGALDPTLSAVDRMIKRITADDPALKCVEE